jgi:hypothetical protein
LKSAIPDREIKIGKRSVPFSIDVNGRKIDLPEWSLLQYAETTVVKLVLIARFHQKVDAIWNEIDNAPKTRFCKQFSIARSIMICLRGCCGSNLIKFHIGQKKNTFQHNNYSCQCSLDEIPDDILPLDLNLRSAHYPLLNVQELNAKSIVEVDQELCSLLVSFQ